MAEVRARPGENIEKLLQRFKKVVENDGILAEYRKREAYEKPSVTRKRKKAAAIKRFKKNEATKKPKISKESWQWNRDRTKKIPTRTRVRTFDKSTRNTTSNFRNKNDSFNKPYKSNYRNKNK